MSRLTIEFEKPKGDWGVQVGWATDNVLSMIPGLRLHRFPVFRTAAGIITFGMPLLQGALPGSRHSGATFDTDGHRKGFLQDLDAALRAANPELFAQERERQE